MENTYNGWTNWETWNFMLWYGDTLEEMITDYQDETENTLEYGQAFEMVNGYIDLLEEQNNLQCGFMSDAVGMAVQKLNIHEITDSLLDE